MRMTLQRDLREFIESLNSNHVRYLVVGGYAVGYHGHPRTTGDLDFLVEISAENSEKLVKAIEDFGFQSLDLTADDFQKPNQIVQFGFPPYRIDLITTVEAVGWEEAWANRVDDEIDGIPTHIIGKTQLMRNKIAVARPKDKADVRALEKRSTKKDH